MILALDTSSAAGSAAIVRDGAIAIARAGDASRTHGERLPRELMTLLDEAHVRLGDIDIFAIATGPGSFTGLRVGIATIQGLALANDTLVVPVSTFEALAAEDGRRRTEDRKGKDKDAQSVVTAIWIDAHRGEVFGTLYASDGTDVLQPPTSLTPAATLDAWSASLAGAAAIRFAGDGAIRYRAVIESRLDGRAEIPTAVPPLAGAVGLIASRDSGRAVRPHAVVPLYVRRPDAELARDRTRSADGA